MLSLTRLEVALELRAPDPDVVRSLERLHPLVERARRRLCVRLRRDHEPDESTKLPLAVKQNRFGRFAGLFVLSGLDYSSSARRRCPRRGGLPRRRRRRSDGRELGRMRPGAQGSEKRTVPSATGARPGCDEVDDVAPGDNAAHAHDRQIDGFGARVHARECDRPERWARVAARTSAERRTTRPAVDRETADRVDRARARPLRRRRPHARTPRCPTSQARASRTAASSWLPEPRRRAPQAVSGASSTFGHERFSSIVSTSSQPSRLSQTSA